MYKHLTTHHYTFTSDNPLVKLNTTNNTIKFKQIVYTITSVQEVFNGYDYLMIYEAEAIRSGASTVRKYKLTLTEWEDLDDWEVVRSIYYRDIK